MLQTRLFLSRPRPRFWGLERYSCQCEDNVVDCRPSTSLVLLKGVYTIQQTSSKRPALARVFWIHLLEVCWTFAGSCKHPHYSVSSRTLARVLKVLVLSHRNQTCPRIWMCNLAPWSNCCSVPKIGIFANEGPQNHPSHCIWYAIWFCMCIRWGRTPFCTKVWFGEKIFFAQLLMLTVVYTTFFSNDETQILFLDSDDIPPIPYHGRELTNIGLLSTLPWLNTKKTKERAPVR